MRKIYFLFVFLILAGCSKKPAVSPIKSNAHIVVTYHFTASVIGNYSLFYTDPNSPKQTVVQFSDTTWSKSDTIKTGSYAEGQTVRIGFGTLASPNTTYSLTISVNNQVKSSSIYTPNTLFADMNYDYQVYY
jgi:hypothetical protein